MFRVWLVGISDCYCLGDSSSAFSKRITPFALLFALGILLDLNLVLSCRQIQSLVLVLDMFLGLSSLVPRPPALIIRFISYLKNTFCSCICACPQLLGLLFHKNHISIFAISFYSHLFNAIELLLPISSSIEPSKALEFA